MCQEMLPCVTDRGGKVYLLSVVTFQKQISHQFILVTYIKQIKTNQNCRSSYK